MHVTAEKDKQLVGRGKVDIKQIIQSLHENRENDEFLHMKEKKVTAHWDILLKRIKICHF